MSRKYDIEIDYMDMTDDRRLWARSVDRTRAFDPVAGRHVVVGDVDADPAVARVVTVDDGGNVELEVLRGSVESHRDLLTRT